MCPQQPATHAGMLLGILNIPSLTQLPADIPTRPQNMAQVLGLLATLGGTRLGLWLQGLAGRVLAVAAIRK